MLNHKASEIRKIKGIKDVMFGEETMKKNSVVSFNLMSHPLSDSYSCSGSDILSDNCCWRLIVFLMLRSYLQNDTFKVLSFIAAVSSISRHPVIIPSSRQLFFFFMCIQCFFPPQFGNTHVCSACRPRPGCSLVCSGSGSERRTAAHSSVHTPRCWWHMNGRLRREKNIKRHHKN